MGAVTDVQLAVNIAGSAIEVSLNSESLRAVAVEGVNNGVGRDVNVTQEGVIVIDDVHGGAEGTALRVGHGTNSEVERPAGIADGTSIDEAEVDNVDLAV